MLLVLFYLTFLGMYLGRERKLVEMKPLKFKTTVKPSFLQLLIVNSPNFVLGTQSLRLWINNMD